MAHDKCLAKCPKNCDCIKDDIEDLKRIKKISIHQIEKILYNYSQDYYECNVIGEEDFLSVAKAIKKLIGD
jgi:hypothetical protein